MERRKNEGDENQRLFVTHMATHENFEVLKIEWFLRFAIARKIAKFLCMVQIGSQKL
jgi:hypothetical protein